MYTCNVYSDTWEARFNHASVIHSTMPTGNWLSNLENCLLKHTLMIMVEWETTMGPMFVAVPKVYQYRNGIQKWILHVTYNWFMYGKIENIHKVTRTNDTLLISIRSGTWSGYTSKAPKLPFIKSLPLHI